MSNNMNDNRTRWSTERRAPQHGINMKPTCLDDDEEQSEIPGAYSIQRRRSQLFAAEQIERREFLLPPPSEIHYAEEQYVQDTLAVNLPPPSSASSGDLDISAFLDEDDRLDFSGDASRRRLSLQDAIVQLRSPKDTATQWYKSKCFLLVCLAGCAIVVGAVTFLVSSSLNSNSNAGDAVVTADDVPEHGPADPALKEISDFRDPLIQCELHEEITDEMSVELTVIYTSLKSFGPLKDHLPSNINATSCDPINVALIWKAMEVVDGYDTLVPEKLINRFVLLVLFISTGGRHWQNKDGWLSRTSECWWHGVECDVTEYNVTGITLSENDLRGSLQSSLGLLTGLQRLELNGNSITGSIPSELWDLTDLEHLLLGDNQLVGSLPTEVDSYQPSLARLSLHKNEIDGRLPPFAELTNLVELDLSMTLIAGRFPTEGFDHRSRLEVLNLGYLIGISGSLPSSLGLLTSLREVYLQDTSLTGTIPESLGNLVFLERLMVVSDVEGSIPTSLGHLTSLVHLVLRNNRFVGTIPTELANCRRLEAIELQENYLNGTVPREFVNLSKLLDLNVACTSITAPVPSGMCDIDRPTTILTNLTQHGNLPGCPCCMPSKAPCSGEDN